MILGERWMAGAAAGILFLPVATHAADPVKVGPEITVSESDYAGYWPRVASDPAGNFMVVWEEGSDESVHARRFHATGNEFLSEFRVSDENQYTYESGSTSTGEVGVAADLAGNFVVTYTAFEYNYVYNGYPTCYGAACLWARRSDANGVKGAAFKIQDPESTYVYAYGQDQVSNPEISALGDGNFVVAWEGYDLFDDGGTPANGGEGTFAARTTSVGQKKGSYFNVADFTEEYQGQYGDLAAAGDTEGNFIVAFRSEYDYSFPGGTIHIQRYDDKGKKIASEMGVSSNDADGYSLDIAQAPDGTFMVVWMDSGDVTGRIFDGNASPLTDDFVINSSGSAQYPPAVAAADASFVVLWNDDEVLGKRFDFTGASLGSEFQVNTSSGGYNPDVGAAANGDFVATWIYDGYAMAQRFQVETPVAQEVGVFGKSLVLTNKVPDDPEKNTVKWKARGPEIVAPSRGTSSDPRCNGDPDGTVKATVRFFSPTSGHDSGVIDLPCQNWLALGGNHVDQVTKRSYRYHDGPLEDGPCSSVSVKGEKSISVRCKGSGDTTDFPYDLEVGISEGTVQAVLDLGLFKYCSSFPPFGSSDGSDGKKFKGRNAAIGPCPP